MSIYGKQVLSKRYKKVIDGKEYESTLGIMDNVYVAPYNGSELRKVKPIKEEEQERQM